MPLLRAMSDIRRSLLLSSLRRAIGHVRIEANGCQWTLTGLRLALQHQRYFVARCITVNLECPPKCSWPSHAYSLFEKRLPIGLMEVIKKVTPETVRQFYARHYHPERMAVVAVGDFPDGGQGMVRGVEGFADDESSTMGSDETSCLLFCSHILFRGSPYLSV